MFVTKIIIGNVFSVLLIGLIVLLKKVLHNKVSLKFQYHVWFVLLFSMAVILVPNAIFQSLELNTLKQETTLSKNASELPVTAPDMVSDDWLHDFTEMSEAVNKIEVNKWLLFFWMAGSLCVLGFYCWGNYKLKIIRRFSEMPSRRVVDIFDYCCNCIRVNKKIRLVQSDMITSPITFGYRTSYIVFPRSIIKKLSDKEIEHIMLHELTHIKNNDIWINFISCFEQFIYWFNPIIWWAFAKMKRDREAYCDWLVLNCYATNEERLCYGDTLLRCATEKQTVLFHSANSMFENKKQLKYRITKIANYKKETKLVKMTEHVFSFILTFTVILQAPFFVAFGSDFGLSYTPKHSMKIIEKDYSSLFNNISGCAVIYDAKNDVYNVYNKSDITKRIAPCSTFKIYSAINALEQGYITPDNNAIKWDRLSRTFPAWNCDQTLNSAMDNSVNWYFQFLDNVAGTERLNKFYQSIGYGNAYIGNDTKYYWNGSSLKISALEQVELLVKLNNNEFGFNENNINAVKNAIFISETNGNKLYGKTGTGRIKNNDVNGWFIGIIETSDNTYSFALNIQAEKNATGNFAAQITQRIFATMGIEIAL